ncbi:MAG: hypothetical protein ACREBE_03925, partial [bacterium]
MSTQDVLIPCRRFDVDVTIGAHDGLSVIEQLLLRGIAAGSSTVDHLANAFGVPPRLVLDCAIDLLGRGLIESLADGALAAHDTVLDVMGDPSTPRKDWYLNFQSGHLPDPQSIPLVQELVAGEVFLARRIPPVDRERLPMMPENADVPDIDEIPRGILLAAVTHAMRTRTQADPTSDLRDVVPRLPRNARIQQVHIRRSGPLGGPANHVSVRRMMLLAHISGEHRGDDTPPRIRVVGPSAIPRLVRSRIGSALDGLWFRGFGRGHSQFFDRISARISSPASEDADAVLAPHLSLARLDDALAMHAEPARKHDVLVEICDEVRPALEQLGNHIAAVDVVTGSAITFRTEALQALSDAQQQVVLACPWIRQLGRAADLQDAILGALRRGVNVVLVWGIDTKALDPSDPATAFIATTQRDARQWPGGLVLATHGAHSHAKVIAQDLDRVLVSSANYLNTDAAKPDREAGLLLRLLDDDCASLPAQSVLAWARRLLPDYLVQERCVDAPILLGRAERRAPFQLGTPILPPQTDLGHVGLDAWTRAWHRRRDELAETAELAQRAVVPVLDAQHRDLFVRAAATAKRRLAVASHRVTTHGLSEQLVT